MTRAKVLTVSDGVAEGSRDDKSGRALVERLTAAGRDGSEPAAVVARGTLPDQRTVTGTLGDIASRVTQAGLRPPAITLSSPTVDVRRNVQRPPQ